MLWNVQIGVIARSTLTLLRCLQLENVCALARRFEGRSMKISKQSIIMVVFFPNEN